MPLPAIETVQVATKATQHYLNRLAATRAGATPVNFVAGQVIVGDGNGAIPPISDLIAAGNVLHEVERGSWIQGVTVNASDPAQTDILVVVPAVSGGEEIGPFWVTEYAITDENGDVCLVGTTAMAKFVTSNGALSDLAWIAAEKESNGDVVLTPPSAAFVTLIEVILLINANRPTAEAPILIEETAAPTGCIRQLFKMRRASQPVEPSNPFIDGPNIGSGRPATDPEFAAKAPRPGGYQFPWVTIQQVWEAIGTIVVPVIPGVIAPIFFDAGQNKYGATLSTPAQVQEGANNAVVVTPFALAESASPQQLVDGATVNWDMSIGYNAKVTLAGNRTLAAPTNPKLGITYSLVVEQDAAGARTLAWASAFKWGAPGAPILSTGAGKRDLVSLICTQVTPAVEFGCALAVKGF